MRAQSGVRCAILGPRMEARERHAGAAHRAGSDRASAARARGSALADTSTLDLVVFLAHNVDDRPVLLAGTLRADEPSSAERMRPLADAVRRSASGVVLELDPLDDQEVAALLQAHAEWRCWRR